MANATILIVEDEGIVAENLAGKLARLGYEVVGVAADGEEAIAQTGRLRPDLVLMDIALDGPMDGIAAADAIRQQRDVPLIYLTAYSDPATLARAKVTGPFGYILKPFEERELAVQIELALYKHRADQEVRQQREWLRVTLTSIGDAVIATDAQGKITFVNPVAESLTGWRADEGLGQPLQAIFRVVNEQTGQPLEDPVVRVLREGRPVALTNHAALMAKDGSAALIEDSAAPILDASRQIVGMVLVFHDVTEKRRAQEQVQEGRQRLAGIVGSAMDAIISVDTGQRIVLFNAAAEKMFRCRAAEAIGQPLERFIPGRFRAIHAEHVRTFGKAGTTGRTMSRLDSLTALRADGEEFPMEASISQVEVGGQRVFTAIIRDISERKRAEEALKRAKEAAETANEAKTRFLANMSHELRTPMNAILGMVDLALPKQADATTRDFLKTAKESADLLLVLLNDLLDCAKVESGKLELEPAPFSLRRALDQITRVLTVRASEKGVGYSCEIAPEVPDALVGDSVRLRQVLLNLGGNGIKFTGRGHVAVTVAVESRQSEEVSLRFAVRDTGIGISQTDLEHLFRPFAQADLSMTRRFGGAGVGLSIASSLVRMMGGRISVESEPGQGSAFHFTLRLPVAKEQAPSSSAPTMPVAAATMLRILVVEDNPANQKLAVYVLEGHGHKIDIAEDGRQGLGMARQNQYDVILMDVQMPVMDGLGATKAIRAWENGRGHVPIIAVTAHAMEEDRQRCLAAGMDGYLSKPINAQEMLAVLHRLAGPLAPLPASAGPAIAPAISVFDPALALKRCMDSRHMLSEMIQCFCDEIESLLPRMKTALEAGDLPEVGRLGHRLKGTVVYLGAEPATEAAQRVAHFSRHSGEQAEVEEAVKTLGRECGVLKSILAEHQLAGQGK